MRGNTGLLVGIGVSVIGSTISNFGQNVQKYAQTLNDELPEDQRKDSYTSLWRWWFGLSCVILGSVCDFGALSLAPQSVVMPVGAFTLVANLFFAHKWLGEPLSARDKRATFFIILGAAGVAVAFGAMGEEVAPQSYTLGELIDLYKRPAMAQYAIGVSSIIVTLWWLMTRAELALLQGRNSPAYRRLAKIHPVTYAALSGMWGSQSVLFAKSTVTLLTVSLAGDNQFFNWETYPIIVAMLCCIVCQTHYLAKGLHFFDSLFIIPVFQCFFIIGSIVGGATYFRELERFTRQQWEMFLAAVALTVYGVLLLSARKMSHSGPAQEGSSDKDTEGGETQAKANGNGTLEVPVTPSPRSRRAHSRSADDADPIYSPGLRLGGDDAGTGGFGEDASGARSPGSRLSWAQRTRMAGGRANTMPVDARPAGDGDGGGVAGAGNDGDDGDVIQDSALRKWAPNMRGLGHKIEVAGKGAFLLPWVAAKDFVSVVRDLNHSRKGLDNQAAEQHQKTGWQFTPHEFKVLTSNFVKRFKSTHERRQSFRTDDPAAEPASASFDESDPTSRVELGLAGAARSAAPASDQAQAQAQAQAHSVPGGPSRGSDLSVGFGFGSALRHHQKNFSMHMPGAGSSPRASDTTAVAKKGSTAAEKVTKKKRQMHVV